VSIWESSAAEGSDDGAMPRGDGDTDSAVIGSHKSRLVPPTLQRLQSKRRRAQQATYDHAELYERDWPDCENQGHRPSQKDHSSDT